MTLQKNARALSLILALPLLAQPALAGDTAALLKDGKFILDFRYRLEDVDQAGLTQDAHAQTARARTGFQTGKINGFSLLAEAETVAHVSSAFNDGLNGKTRRPLVADPEGMELNRLQVDYTGIAKTAITLGRQRLNLDNQRFIGAVGFRQNEQTLDALKITTQAIDKLDLTYAYVAQVNRVFGHKSPQGEFEGDSHLFNAGLTLSPAAKITGYAYLLDLEEQPLLSTATYGGRVAGKYTLDKVTLTYAADYAHQSDYQGNPRNLSLDYAGLELTATYDGLSLGGGYESLEGNGVRGFATPLATLHKFQGYADVFLTTPANGVNDAYGRIGYETKLATGPITGLSAALWYHDFEAERIDRSYGSEIDVEAAVKLGPKVTVSAKYADYDGDGAFPDRRKFWLAFEYSY